MCEYNIFMCWHWSLFDNLQPFMLPGCLKDCQETEETCVKTNATTK